VENEETEKRGRVVIIVIRCSSEYYCVIIRIVPASYIIMAALNVFENSTLIVEPESFEFHPALISELHKSMEQWCSVKTKTFLDKSPYLKVGINQTETAIIPQWITKDVEHSVFRMMEIGNALYHEEEGYERRATRRIFSFPYIESRGDKITRVRTDISLDEYDTLPNLLTADHKRLIKGESVYAQIISDAIAGPTHATDVQLLDPHSVLLLRYLEKHRIKVQALTAVPLFAQWAITHDLVDDDTVVVSPDIGAISRSSYLAELLGLPLVVCDKWRPQHNASQVSLRYGSVKKKRAIGLDDVIDSAGTICEGAEVLKNEGVSELIVMSTSGKFSGPAISRLDNAIHSGLISRVVVTDNLPSFAKGRMLGTAFDYVSIAPLLVSGLLTMMDDNADENTYGLRPFLMRDELPVEAYTRIQSQFNLPPLE